MLASLGCKMIVDSHWLFRKSKHRNTKKGKGKERGTWYETPRFNKKCYAFDLVSKMRELGNGKF